MGKRTSAQEVLSAVLDPGSWVPWDVAPVAQRVRDGHSQSYRDELQQAAQRAGTDESVLVGHGRVKGRRVGLIVSEFDFLAGSVGLAAASRIVQGVEQATAQGLPLLAATASGGTRMQEGTPAFVAMVGISAAIAAHRAAGLPYLVYLRHPTTGGVFASWGSLGHMLVAEPGALVGFLGPRVYEALYGSSFPEGVQTAEHLAAHGVIDAVLPLEHVATAVERALHILVDPPHPVVANVVPQADRPARRSVWSSVERSRRSDRPGIRKVLRHSKAHVVALSGTGTGERDAGLLLAAVRIHGQSLILLAQDRRGQAQQGPLGPGALRQARRGMALATELGLPLVTVVDTTGAALSVAAEEGGLASEIARTLAHLVTLPVPTVSLLLGPGTGGAALAMLPADRVLACEHAWLSPLPPEGASAIRYRTLDRADEMADHQGVWSWDLLDAGIVDEVLQEPDLGDPSAVHLWCDGLAATIAGAVASQRGLPAQLRRGLRLARYRRLAGVSS